MSIVCAWCGTVLLDHGLPISHGICFGCFTYEEETKDLTEDLYCDLGGEG